MLFCLQIALYCLLFFLLVKCAVKNDGRNCLYFYPTAYIDEAQRRGLAEHGDVMRRGKRFMIPFCAVMLIALVLIVGVWNRASTFRAAYAQTAVLLVVMNWFDGIVIDRLWVGRSKIWRIEGMEGVPYVKPWKTVLIKRGLGTVLYLLLSPAFAAAQRSADWVELRIQRAGGRTRILLTSRLRAEQ